MPFLCEMLSQRERKNVPNFSQQVGGRRGTRVSLPAANFGTGKSRVSSDRQITITIPSENSSRTGPHSETETQILPHHKKGKI